jgi:hypothetical protein
MSETHYYFVGDGHRLRISNMLDIDGGETADPEEAVTIVARLSNGEWLASECWPGDIVAITICFT